jgi:hypothetical protein
MLQSGPRNLDACLNSCGYDAVGIVRGPALIAQFASAWVGRSNVALPRVGDSHHGCGCTIQTVSSLRSQSPALIKATKTHSLIALGSHDLRACMHARPPTERRSSVDQAQTRPRPCSIRPYSGAGHAKSNILRKDKLATPRGDDFIPKRRLCSPIILSLWLS